MNFSVRRLINILVVSSSISLLILGLSAILSNFMMNKNQKQFITAMDITTLSRNISNLIVTDIVRQANYSDNARQGKKISVALAVQSDTPFYAFYDDLKLLSKSYPQLDRIILNLNEEYDRYVDIEMAIIKNVNTAIDLRLKFKQQFTSIDSDINVLKRWLQQRKETEANKDTISANFTKLLLELNKLKNQKMFISSMEDIKNNLRMEFKYLNTNMAPILHTGSKSTEGDMAVKKALLSLSNKGFGKRDSVYYLRNSIIMNQDELLKNQKGLFQSVLKIGEHLSELKFVVSSISDETIKASKQLSMTILTVVTCLSIMFLAFFYFLGRNILSIISNSLSKLISAMVNISSGKRGLDSKVDVPPQQELAQLSNSFNDMIAQLRQSQLDMEILNNAYQRFVPEKGLQLLGKQSIIEINLGDHIECNMSVLFSDIRDFTSITENMTSSESFSFVNEYLKIMEPVIEKHHGFIDKYIGDAVMALFPDKDGADNAINAGLAMMSALDELNQMRISRGDEAINIGVGINTGNLILGTIGGEVRLEETVIGDTVNVASRMESLNKQFGTQILISESTYQSISEDYRKTVRNIGFTAIKGKAEKATAYEVFSHNTKDLIGQKQKVAPMLLNACAFIERGEHKNAQGAFSNCRKLAPNDPVILYYIEYLMNHNRRHGDKPNN